MYRLPMLHTSFLNDIIFENGVGPMNHPAVDHVLHEARRLMGEGWCNSMYNLGDVIHEIGHVIGMNHEHHDGVIQGMIFGARSKEQ